jgi:hypothetical protein
MPTSRGISSRCGVSDTSSPTRPSLVPVAICASQAGGARRGVRRGPVAPRTSSYNSRVANIRVMHFGLGPIGVSVLKQVFARPGLTVAGGIDVDPAKVGRNLGEIAGLRRRAGLTVSGDAVKALKAAKPDVVVLCTSSSLEAVMPQIETILASKVPIVSTTEELAYPLRTNARQARQIHAWATKARVAVLGTGVNPGFAMDALPIALTAVCERVDGVLVQRVQDARIRRLPFQLKIGAGLTAAQFRQQVAKGSVRHVGLAQSITMIADALGWKLDRVTDRIEPKIASSSVGGDLLAVDAGYVCGIVQDGIGYRKRTPAIRLHMEAYLGAPETYDAIEVEGSPHLKVRIDGGIHGDVATVAIVVNSIPTVLGASPGLHTMRDLPLPSFFPGR